MICLPFKNIMSNKQLYLFFQSYFDYENIESENRIV